MGLSTHGYHSGLSTHGCCLGLSTHEYCSELTHMDIAWGPAQSGLSTIRAQHTRASLSTVLTGCAKLLGSGPAPGSLCLFPEVLLAFRLCQVHGLAHIALSGSPLPLLAVCSLPWEKTPSQTCSPQSLCSALTLAWAEAMVSCSLCNHVPHRAGPQDSSL